MTITLHHSDVVQPMRLFERRRSLYSGRAVQKCRVLLKLADFQFVVVEKLMCRYSQEINKGF